MKRRYFVRDRTVFYMFRMIIKGFFREPMTKIIFVRAYHPGFACRPAIYCGVSTLLYSPRPKCAGRNPFLPEFIASGKGSRRRDGGFFKEPMTKIIFVRAYHPGFVCRPAIYERVRGRFLSGARNRIIFHRYSR